MAMKVLHNRYNTCTLDYIGIHMSAPSLQLVQHAYIISQITHTHVTCAHTNSNIYPQLLMNVCCHHVDKYVQILLEAISAPVMMGMNWTMMEELVMVCLIDDTV